MKRTTHILISISILCLSLVCNILGTEYGPRTITIMRPVYQNHNTAYQRDKSHTGISITESIIK